MSKLIVEQTNMAKINFEQVLFQQDISTKFVTDEKKKKKS